MSNRRLIREKRDTNNRENAQLRKENEQLKRQLTRLRRELEKEPIEEVPVKKPTVPIKAAPSGCCDKPDIIEIQTPSGVVRKTCRSCRWRG